MRAPKIVVDATRRPVEVRAGPGVDKATTTHQRLTPAQRAELGISDGLVRLSVGLEHPDDLVEDLITALAAV